MQWSVIENNLSTLESVLEEKLNESNSKLSNIEEELNWWEDRPTLAKQLLAALGTIDSSLHDIDFSINTSAG